MKLDATATLTAAITEAVKAALTAGLAGSDVAAILDQIKAITEEEESVKARAMDGPSFFVASYCCILTSSW